MKTKFIFSIVFLFSSIILKAQTQKGWFFCTKCSSLFFEASKGVCAAGGDHARVRPNNGYILSYGTSTCNGQPDWNWCKKCSCLFFGPNNLKCPAGDKHEREASTTVSYILCYTKNGAPIDANHQSEWAFCNKCSCLFFWQNPGVCAAGGKHYFTNETSGNYVLAH